MRHKLLLSAEKETRKFSKNAGKILIVFILIFIAATIIMPYVWVVLNSIKGRQFFTRYPYTLIIKKPTLESYRFAFIYGNIGLYLKNSFFYATTVVGIQLIIDSLAAYAFSRLYFRGRDLLFSVLLATMLIPFAVIMIPSYIIIYTIGLANSFLGVVMPYFAGVFGIFFLRQFFLNIPKELDAAARVDGAGPLRIYITIILPLAKPALLALGIFLFLFQWNNFLWPLIVLSDNLKYPLTTGIALFAEHVHVDWASIFAASVVASLPIIASFFVLRRYFIGGIVLSGLKG